MTAPQTGTLFWLPKILSDRSLDATTTLLMVGLADHVDGDDECHVGIQRLADYARCSYGTARRKLAALEQMGLLERTRRRREDGNLSTYQWRLVRAEQARTVRDGLAPTQTRDDQRAPESAVTSAHEGARAEPPSGGPPSGEEPSTPRSEPEILAAGFDAFWMVYPSKGKRADAAKAWPRAVKAAGGFGPIMAGAERYADERRGEDPRYTAHGSTWLTGERWNDPPRERRGKPVSMVRTGEAPVDHLPTGRVSRDEIRKAAAGG